LERLEKEKSASLEVEVDAKTTSLQELSQRLVNAEAQIKTKEEAIRVERVKAEELHAQIAQFASAEAVHEREVKHLQEELNGAKDHNKAMEEMLERKNKNIAALEAEVQSVEAELAKVESQLALFKRQASDRSVEAQSQKVCLFFFFFFFLNKTPKKGSR
jgi:chromosome segregation ATPase